LLDRVARVAPRRLIEAADVTARCRPLALHRPAVMGCSIGGRIARPRPAGRVKAEFVD
jgi:hypothetical protein